MKTFPRWWEMGYAPLLARCGFVLGLMTPILFAVLYPQREQEAEAYEHAPACMPTDNPDANCRRLAEVTYVGTDCQRNGLSKHPDDFCEMELRVDGQKSFIAVDRARTESLRPGDIVRVELFGRAPTAIATGGTLVLARGNPREATRSLRWILFFWIPIDVICAIYLYRERRLALLTEH